MKRLNLLILLFTLTAAMVGAQTSFKILPPSNVVEGNNFQVSYVVYNGNPTSMDTPEIGSGCRLLYNKGVSQMTSNINGKVSTEIRYSHTYLAEKAGKYTIPAATVKVDGKTYTAQAVSFEVLPPGKNSQPNNGGQQYGGGSARPTQPTTSDRNVSLPDDYIFVKLIPNKTTVYNHEPIECELKVYTRNEQIQMLPQSTAPSYEGFIFEEVDIPTPTLTLEHYNGENYYTAVIRKFLLYPQKPGTTTLSSGDYSFLANFTEYLNRGMMRVAIDQYQRQIDAKPSSFKVNVLPLPTPQPAEFNGAVGKFTFDTKLSSTKLRTGEAASITMTIQGTGNIKFIEAPTVNFPVELQKYTEKTSSNAKVSGANMTGTQTIEVPFVAEIPGQYTISPIKFVYFNPATKSYETLESPSYEINVTKGLGTSTGSVDRQDIEQKNKDIRYIVTGEKVVEKSPTIYSRTLLYWLLYPALIAVLVVVLLIVRQRTKANADVVGVKMSKARKVARRRLAEANSAMKAGNKDAFYDSILKALWGYLSDKLAIPVSGLSRENIKDELLGYGAPEELGNKVVALLDECEMARYTPESQLTPMPEIKEQTSDLIKELDSVTKRKK